MLGSVGQCQPRPMCADPADPLCSDCCTADGACFTGADFRRCDAKSASLIWGGGVRFDRKGEAQKFFYKVSEASLREREIYVYVFTFARELSL